MNIFFLLFSRLFKCTRTVKAALHTSLLADPEMSTEDMREEWVTIMLRHIVDRQAARTDRLRDVQVTRAHLEPLAIIKGYGNLDDKKCTTLRTHAKSELKNLVRSIQHIKVYLRWAPRSERV